MSILVTFHGTMPRDQRLPAVRQRTPPGSVPIPPQFPCGSQPSSSCHVWTFLLRPFQMTYGGNSPKLTMDRVRTTLALSHSLTIFNVQEPWFPIYVSIHSYIYVMGISIYRSMFFLYQYGYRNHYHLHVFTIINHSY